jgi:tRNA nucleotidyltransferase (CCA-adding enzyme)
MIKQTFVLSRNVNFIISELNKNGYRADIVGGCVRDNLRGRVPNDYDITTDAQPEEVLRVFSKVRTVKTGIKHGTVTVVLAGEPYEVTTWRIDGEYTDNRHPDSVSFASCLEDDLSRRDFTVNAMAYNPKDGFSDPYHGMDDLAAGIIRAVGDPVRRFSEDALRILRALRFAATLDFKIEEQTSAAIFECKSLLLNVSYERIYEEWKKLISGVGAYRILSKYSSVISMVIPELIGMKLPCEHSFATANPMTRELSLFAMTHGGNASSAYLSAAARLRMDNKHKKLATAVLDNISRSISNEADIRALLMRIGEEGTREVISLVSVLGSDASAQLEMLSEILERGDCYKLSQLKINGKDLQAMGYSGKAVGEKLSHILEAVVAGELENLRDVLLDFAKKQK